MIERNVQYVILCEDRQQEVFVRRLLIKQGVDERKIRTKPAPPSRGAAEQFVRDEFTRQLTAHRQICNHLGCALVVVVDADTLEVTERIQELRAACEQKGIPFRAVGERIAFIIPKRNIETWIYFLRGQQVNEQTAYPKLKYESDCAPQVARLAEMCQKGALEGNPPASLELACTEYRERLAY